MNSRMTRTMNQGDEDKSGGTTRMNQGALLQTAQMTLVVVWALFVHLFMVVRWQGSEMGSMCVKGGVGHRESGVGVGDIVPVVVYVSLTKWIEPKRK